ncbi:ABC transporter permease [Streptomyces sp. CNQ085]|uniref:ABC transporter permease n=1 Tax=Streptomyces sp. CNQ085 TaxID=2886944 RepID=UPI001F512921|nr:ABC transporter permease [Streptomyces sp. CNQ085]MCI0386639.1 ABC transporter permease [Streptomyces sp. CNQ085]
MFLTYLRRELRRRGKAALLVASGLALGIALVIVVSSVSTGMKQAQDEVLESLYGLGTDMTVTKAQQPREEGEQSRRPRFRFDAGEEGEEQSNQRLVVQGFQTLGADTVDTIAEQDGVAAAVGGLALNSVTVDGEFARGELRGRGGPGEQGDRVEGGGADFRVETHTLYGTDVRTPGLGPLTSSAITDGRGFGEDETDADVAVVDSAHAESEDIAVGDSLDVAGTGFEVVGIATADSGQPAAQVYIPLARAQELADAEDTITTVYVRATDSQRIEDVKAAVLKEIPDTTVTTSADLAKTVSGSLGTAADLAEGVGRWLSYAVLAAAFLVAGLLTSSAVGRRVREFGTLKALGWRSGRVTRQVMGEALANGLLGGGLGIALGCAGAYAVTAVSPTLTASLGAAPGAAAAGRGPGRGAARLLGQEGERALEIALTAPVDLRVIASAVTLAVAGGLVAGAFGAWRAARLRPADALRRVA